MHSVNNEDDDIKVKLRKDRSHAEFPL